MFAKDIEDFEYLVFLVELGENSLVFWFDVWAWRDWKASLAREGNAFVIA